MLLNAVLYRLDRPAPNGRVAGGTQLPGAWPVAGDGQGLQVFERPARVGPEAGSVRLSDRTIDAIKNISLMIGGQTLHSPLQ